MPSCRDDLDARVRRRLTLRAMRESDLTQVLAIENRSFVSPWQRGHFLHELRENRWADCRVVQFERRVIGYACVWFLDDELKINNFAIAAPMRGRGVGGWLLARLLREARRRGCREATLEVRPSNQAALHLYRRHGFVEIGRRKNYYALEGEDAILMRAPIVPDSGVAPDRGAEL